MSNEIAATTRAGTLIAAAAAALVLAGCASTDSGSAKPATMAKVHCQGVNACKGHGACKTAENACKGQNVCKGHGFLVMSAEECKSQGGKIM